MLVVPEEPVPEDSDASIEGGRSEEGPDAGPSTPSLFHRGRKERLEAAPGLHPGKVVGDFRLVALVGQGGMGQIWEAQQLSLGRRVAVKFVLPDRVTERQLEFFAREARAGGRLHHPGIVTIFGHGTSAGLAWIAMEFVEGAWTLKDFLDDVARTPGLPDDYDRHVAALVAEIADGMQVAHDVGVIHRDLKPHNILITSEDRPKITDFGLARLTDESALSLTGELAGTYAYMSPEQVTARRIAIDHRTDVFSLGVVLYELLTFQRPFQGDTEHQIAEQIVLKDPPDPRTIRSRIPRELAVITGKALEKDRDRRYATMRELAADLRRFLAHETIRARPPTPRERLVKLVRRHPARSAAGALAGVAFLAVTQLLIVSARSRSQMARANEALSLKTTEAQENAARADREAAAATRQAQLLLRLSALQTLDDLTRASDRLWPAVPANLTRYDDWLRAAEALLAELPQHRATLAQLRARALPAADAGAGEEGLWRFRDETDRWWHDQQAKLVAGLESFADPATGLFSAGIAPGHGWGVRRRREFASTLEEQSLSGPEARRRWEEACASIADPARCPRYRGLRLVPQLGLLPLGRDPASELWEFAHLQSGAAPARRADGTLELREDTGLVLVLLPAGTFRMGAQASDPAAPNYDPEANWAEGPVREVSVPAFFLSKYEMTQGQWLHLTGENPSAYTPETYQRSWSRDGMRTDLLQPVEQVSWTECTRRLAQLGLELPTEAQWEYGARAGTDSAWWTGDTPDGLELAGNLADRYAKEHGGTLWQITEDWDDGHTAPARVGSFAANDFGLHDTIGNVWEPCQELYAPDTLERVSRGGSYGFGANSARSACRGLDPPDDIDSNLGVRPARAVAP